MVYGFLLEFLKELHNKGVSWGAVLTALILWNKMNRNKRLQAQDERMELKIDAIMQKVGAEWSSGQPKKCKLGRLNYKRSFLLSRMVKRPKEEKKMQINKVWLSGIIAWILGQAALKYGFKFDVAWADMAADIIINYVIPLVTALLNRHKGEDKNAKYPTDTGSAV